VSVHADKRSVMEEVDAPDDQSFIVKLWVESVARDGEPASWRGRITHVPSGRQAYIQSLAELPPFIAPYLEGMGVKLPAWLRLLRLLQAQRGRWQRTT
jgi:hypothetical protein